MKSVKDKALNLLVFTKKEILAFVFSRKVAELQSHAFEFFLCVFVSLRE
jgi:hypothetical protein